MADEVFDFNLSKLKIKDIVELEEVLGESIADAFTTGRPLGKAIQAVAYVVKKRDNPDFTFEEAGELEIDLEQVTSPKSDPTTAG